MASQSPIKANVTTSGGSLMKRSHKFKIVQPEAVKRRIKKNGSKRPVSKGRDSKICPQYNRTTNCIPLKPPTQKRRHVSSNVLQNEPVAKKAGRNMVSKSKFTKLEQSKVRSKILKTDPSL